MPEFYFNVSPSVTPLEIHYNTDGSTLPSSLMGPLNSGEVTVPVGESSVFVPFTPANDGKVAAMRFAVVTTIVPGDDNPTSARMSVNSPAKPTVTIAGASDNAVIPVDPQGDDAKLVPIAMNVTYAGQLQNCSLEWDGTFIMWPTDKIGPPGTDLGSQPGAFHDPYNGTTSYTWDGVPPSVVYAQAIGGSANWDSTGVSLSANVIQPATSKVSAIQGEADKGAYGTADGPELIWDGKAVTGVMAGDVVLGEGVSIQAVWLGPITNPLAGTDTFWNVQSKAVAGYNMSVGLGYINDLTPYLHTDWTDGGYPTLHFYWVDPSANGSAKKTVGLSGTIDGMSVDVKTTFNVITPSSTFNLIAGPKPAWSPNGFASNVALTFGTAGNPGVIILGTVTNPAISGGSTWMTQLVNSVSSYDVGPHTWIKDTHGFVLDAGDGAGDIHYNSPEKGDANATPHFSDHDTPFTQPPPTATWINRSDNFESFLMWQSSLQDSIPVALQEAEWNWYGATPLPMKIPTTVGDDSVPASGHLASLLPEWNNTYNGFSYIQIR